LIGISLFWIIFTNQPKPQIMPENPVSEQFVSASALTVKIEEVSGGNNLSISSGQEIASTNQLKTLIINDKHRLIMNENTTLSIKPISENEHIGCVINLVSGQIYAHVEHDGNPFVVETAYGKAVITGTTFDIKAMDTDTTLIVAEGTVQFTSQIGLVEVSAGYKSEIIAKSSPTTPSICDAEQLTAWATGYELKTALAKMESIVDSDISDLFDISDIFTVSFSDTGDLQEINYQEWVEQKREWFAREFPQIFQLKEALANEQIKVDYPELLFTSGNLWQFTYEQALIKKIPVITFNSLLKAGYKYGCDEQWFLENIPASKALMAKPEGILTGQNAFHQWSEQFKQMKKSQQSDSDVFLSSLLASVYLANTRTLAWLYITNENTVLSAENRTEILSLLQNEVNTAEKLKEYIIRLFAVSEKLPCEESNVLIDQIIDSVEAIMDIEERVSEYEIGK
ncbi:MAG: FecR domain-containing protein, partial [Sedimentisphaerales bacterium]|nr:FecR domain-containing protein [Sedimentisphaerales bacterium]